MISTSVLLLANLEFERHQIFFCLPFFNKIVCILSPHIPDAEKIKVGANTNRGSKNKLSFIKTLKLKIKSVDKDCRGYFNDSSISEMLLMWSHLLCPTDRSMSLTRYFSLFLPNTKDIPPEHYWQVWLPLF